MSRLLPFLLAVWLALPLAAREYRIDRNHSTIGFTAPILGGLSKVGGKFTDFSVQLDFDADRPETSSIRAVIRPGSIDTGIAERDEHLRAPDFFDAGQFPEAVFASTRIEKTAASYVAHGRLTIRDVTREIALPFALTGRSEKGDDKGRLETLGFAAGCTINRRDFGMDWTHSVDPLFVGDLIQIEITLLTRATRIP